MNFRERIQTLRRGRIRLPTAKQAFQRVDARVPVSVTKFGESAGRAALLSVCDYDWCADLHVLEQPLGIWDVHSDAAV